VESRFTGIKTPEIMPRLSNKQKKLRSIARARKTQFAQVLAAWDSDSDNEPDNDSDILSAISRQSNERRKERKKRHSSSKISRKDCPHVPMKLHRPPASPAVSNCSPARRSWWSVAGPNSPAMAAKRPALPKRPLPFSSRRTMVGPHGATRDGVIEERDS
jgi:hypothetical protein